MDGWVEGETLLWICSKIINVRNHLLIYLCLEQVIETAPLKISPAIMHLISSCSQERRQRTGRMRKKWNRKSYKP